MKLLRVTSLKRISAEQGITRMMIINFVNISGDHLMFACLTGISEVQGTLIEDIGMQVQYYH